MKTLTIVLLIAGWLALLAATTMALLAAIQAIGIGLGLLVTVRIAQQWRTP